MTVSPTGVYTDVAFDGEDGSYTSLEWTVRPLVSPPNDGYFWSREFGGYGWDGTAYMGVQTRVYGVGDNEHKGILASIPNAVEAEAVHPDAVAITTEPEYVGWSIRMAYPWVAGVGLDLAVRKGASGAGGTRWWGFYVTDQLTGDETYMGRIRVPAGWGDLWGNGTCFSERYSGTPMVTCADQGYAATEFSGFTANAGAIPATGYFHHLANPATCDNASVEAIAGGGLHRMGIPPSGAGSHAVAFNGGSGGLCYHTLDGYYELNGVVLASGAVWCNDLWDLLLGPEKKGDNGVQPHAPGTFPNPMRWAQTDYDLPILISGEIDVSTGLPWDVAPPSDSAAFERNILWLRRHLGVDPDGTSTVPSIFHTPDGLNAAGDCQPLRILRGQILDAPNDRGDGHGLHMVGKLRVRYPGGGPIFPPHSS